MRAENLKMHQIIQIKYFDAVNPETCSARRQGAWSPWCLGAGYPDVPVTPWWLCPAPQCHPHILGIVLKLTSREHPHRDIPNTGKLDLLEHLTLLLQSEHCLYFLVYIIVSIIVYIIIMTTFKSQLNNEQSVFRKLLSLPVS